MTTLSGFPNQLARLIVAVDVYRYGFENVPHYLLVGVCVGFALAHFNVICSGFTWKDLQKGDRDDMNFILIRFLGGFLGWPAFLGLLPLGFSLMISTGLYCRGTGYIAHLWQRRIIR